MPRRAKTKGVTPQELVDYKYLIYGLQEAGTMLFYREELDFARRWARSQQVTLYTLPTIHPAVVAYGRLTPISRHHVDPDIVSPEDYEALRW